MPFNLYFVYVKFFMTPKGGYLCIIQYCIVCVTRFSIHVHTHAHIKLELTTHTHTKLFKAGILKLSYMESFRLQKFQSTRHKSGCHDKDLQTQTYKNVSKNAPKAKFTAGTCGTLRPLLRQLSQANHTHPGVPECHLRKTS